MISVVRTAVVLVLILDFLQLAGGGKEYGRFMKLVTGLLIAGSLIAGLLQLTGSLSWENWLSWLEGEQSDMEGLVEENTSVIPVLEDQTEKNRDIVTIEVPLVEEIPQIVVEEIQVGEERNTQ